MILQRIFRRLALTAKVLVYGPAQTKNTFDVPQLSAEEVAEARSFFPLEKYFVFGHARSGTTLLARLLRVHPDVHCNWQAHFFTRQPLLNSIVDTPEIREWLSRSSNRWNRGTDLSPVVLRAVSDYILERDARPLGVRVVGDKSPNAQFNDESVRLAHKVYPDGKIVFIVRDGRDAAVSHRFQSFIDAPQYLSKADLKIRSDFEQDPDAFLNGERSIFTEQAITNAATSWVNNVALTDARGRDLYQDRYISLRYEDLLADSWGQMARLWEFLGVDTRLPELPGLLTAELSSNPDRDWQKEKSPELVSPLKKGKSGSWRNLFTDRDRAIFSDIAGDVLKAWGYKRS